MIRRRAVRHLVIAALASTITSSACALFTGPKDHSSVTVKVTPDTIIAQLNTSTNVTWVQFTIPITIHNGLSSELLVNFCQLDILAATGGGVYEPNCFDIITTSLKFVPGETRTLQWPVSAAIGGPGNPKWNRQTVDGVYHVRLALGAEAAWISNEFVISELTTSTVAVRAVARRAAFRR